MKIICEYCGSTIDVNKDDKCPNCMASYKDNKMFKERIEDLKKEKELEYEEKKLNMENKRMANEQAKRILGAFAKVSIVSKIIFIIPLIMFILIITLAIKQFNNNSNRESTINHLTTTTTKIKEKEVTVHLNEYGEVTNYKVKVDEIISLDKLYGVLSPSENKKFKVFHIIVENKLDKTIRLDQRINCIVDGYVQKETFYYSKYPDLPYSLDAGLKTEGYVIYEVPKDASEYTIKYGDYINIVLKEEE